MIIANMFGSSNSIRHYVTVDLFSHYWYAKDVLSKVLRGAKSFSSVS